MDGWTDGGDDDHLGASQDPRAQSPARPRVGGNRWAPFEPLPVPYERERKPERITEQAGSAGISSAPRSPLTLFGPLSPSQEKLTKVLSLFQRASKSPFSF